MELIFRICLFLSGVINILPVVLVFLPKKIKDSYGIEIPNANYELLLRHRAVLFGIIGGVMIYSAITKQVYSLAVYIGLISMISFIILIQFVNGEINPELKKVRNIDILGIIILLIGYVIFKFIDNEETEWDAFGNAINGPRAGASLAAPLNYIGYWFAWVTFNEELSVF